MSVFLSLSFSVLCSFLFQFYHLKFSGNSINFENWFPFSLKCSKGIFSHERASVTYSSIARSRIHGSMRPGQMSSRPSLFSQLNWIWWQAGVKSVRVCMWCAPSPLQYRSNIQTEEKDFDFFVLVFVSISLLFWVV